VRIKKMYSLMTVIVERGKAEKAVEIANKTGAVCVTIINGRGAGIHETSKVFCHGNRTGEGNHPHRSGEESGG
jgi:nitrogen regulatory protein P-II